jgi:DNA-binding SARP family transcriptional activator
VAGTSYRILGAVEVWCGGRRVPVPGRQPVAVLAVLLLNANRVVSVDRLVDHVWGAAAPPTARPLLQSCVAELRRALRAGGAGEPVVRRHPGYLFQVGPGELDADRFVELVSAARGDPGDAGRLLREAIALWRGPALDGLPLHGLTGELTDLEERRLAALEDRVDADLRAGQRAELVGELRSAVAAHPYRERLWAALLVTLAGCDRQAEALAAYRRFRDLLVDQVGVEPGPALQALHQAVLAGTDLYACYVGDPTPELAPAEPARPAAVPEQLPWEVRGFTGRDAELAALDAVLADREPTAMPIALLSGTAGVGKSALAVRWSRRVADRFPDGQLYVDLRGYDADRPVGPAEALAGFLRALGVAGPALPVELRELAARYRSALSRRRLLVLLDNAGSVEQVRPLLPGTPSCLVLVTSRDSLGGLVATDGAHRIALDLLPPVDAVNLLRRLVHPRGHVELAATAALAEHCARLPLALRVAAERANARPATPLHDLVAELADQRRRLDVLDAGGDTRAAVRVVFSWSYQQLPAGTARAFRLAGLHPGPDLDAWGLAALAGDTPAAAGRWLESLTQAHVMHRVGASRYGMHDLLRAYAVDLAEADEAGAGRVDALERLFDYLLSTAAGAMALAHPARRHRRPVVPPAGSPTPMLADPAAALRWLDAERPALVGLTVVAARHGWSRRANDLGRVLYRYLDAGGHHDAALTIHRHGYDAAGRAGDRTGQAHAMAGLGAVHFRLGRYGAATEAYQQAFLLHHRTGDQAGAAQALLSLGAVAWRRGNTRHAAACLRRAHAVYASINDPVGAAHALSNLGLVHESDGHYPAAVDHHTRALALLADSADRGGQANALTNLGNALLHLGRHRDSADQHQQALALFREVGDRHGEADALNGLGEALTAGAHPRAAAGRHGRAAELAESIGNRYEQARALRGLGDAALATGARDSARDQWRHALDLFTALGLPDAVELRGRLSAMDPARVK